MDQPSAAERAPNEADASDLDVSSDAGAPPPHHRSDHSGALGHRKSRHHRVSYHTDVPQHRGGSHHHSELQDSPNRTSSGHSHLHHHHHSPRHGGAHRSASPAPSASRDTVPSRHSYAEDLSDDERQQSSRRPNSRPFHRSESRPPGGPSRHSRLHRLSDISHHSGLPPEGQPYSHRESYRDSEASDQGGPQHHDAYDQGRRRNHQAPHHRRSILHGETHPHPAYGGSSHQAIPHYSSEHRRGHRGHHGEHRHREHQHGAQGHNGAHSGHYKEYHHAGAWGFGLFRSRSSIRVSPARSPSAALPPGQVRTQSLTRPHPAVHPRAAKDSGKVHPQDSVSKTSGSWAEDEQFQKRKTGRVQRAHKKLHSWLWETFSNLFNGLRKMLRSMTDSLVFDAFIFLVVCLNTIMLVAQTFAEVEIRGEWYFMAFDSIFLSIYVVEAVLKIIAMGRDYFYDVWNNLDFVIMVMAVLDFSLMQFNSRSFKRTIYNQSVFRIFKVFKSLRALRAVRVLRRLSFLTSLQEVTGTLARSLPSIAAILVLMFTCLFLFSVVLRAMFRQSDPKRFQNILTTIFTLFTLLTLDDWSQIYLDSQAQGAWHIIPILMVYIIIQYFIFLNLVIAVLVDNFQMALLRGLEKVKQERAAKIQEPLLYESLAEFSSAEAEEVMSEHAKQKHFLEKKFGTMTEKQRELLFHFLQLAAGVEHYQQKFRSQASVIDEIVDTAFEAGEEDFRK
ncbi:cation channel sperm-associated protein 1 [Artibeus jamaicensis]|uniref:cation channel sperm-associated protein 1 n=1 Tax=Artibeus jamaicensis TaxID=9417 RepID=UPI00235A94B2|nr:cation channel sperm-associated protein 1 [Artibeus jamaicensis]